MHQKKIADVIVLARRGIDITLVILVIQRYNTEIQYTKHKTTQIRENYLNEYLHPVLVQGMGQPR
jgi:hypothetical protein